MAEYISREAANKALCEFCGICAEPGDLKECEIVSNYSFPHIPSADVVEVVRCKNCKHRPEIVDPRRPYGNGLEGPRIDQFGYDDTCPYLCGDSWYNRMPNDDGFCDLGEAKDG